MNKRYFILKALYTPKINSYLTRYMRNKFPKYFKALQRPLKTIAHNPFTTAKILYISSNIKLHE